MADDRVPWIVRFVDKPDVDRTVRLDLNDEEYGGNVYVDPDGFSLGTTEMLVAVTESMLSDNPEVTARRRDTREIVIPLCIVGKDDEVAAVVNSVAREVDRTRNYLEFKPGEHTGESVFFTVLQGDITEVRLDPDEFPEVKGAQVTLLCQPVAVGLRLSGSAAVSNNPATGQVLSLPRIRGDVAAPLNVELVSAATDVTYVPNTALVSSHTNPVSPAVRLLQAEAGVTGTNTTLTASGDAAMSGGGYARTTFATSNTLMSRVIWAGVNLTFGTYKVLARVRKTVAGDVFDVRRRLTTAGGLNLDGPTRRYNATTYTEHWLDLGQVTVPVGHAPPDTTSGVVGDLSWQAMRVSGSGSLDVDCFKLVPTQLVDAPPGDLAITWYDKGGDTVILGLDAEADAEYTALSTGQVGIRKTRPGGTMPKVHPGHDNHLVVMASVGIVPDSDGFTKRDMIAWNTTVSWNYRPKFLYVSEPG